MNCPYEKNLCQESTSARTRRNICHSDYERCWKAKDFSTGLEKYLSMNDIKMIKEIHVK